MNCLLQFTCPCVYKIGYEEGVRHLSKISSMHCLTGMSNDMDWPRNPRCRIVQRLRFDEGSKQRKRRGWVSEEWGSAGAGRSDGGSVA